MNKIARIKYTLSVILAFILLAGCTQSNRQTETDGSPSPIPASAVTAPEHQSPSASANSTPNRSSSSPTSAPNPAAPSTSAPETKQQANNSATPAPVRHSPDHVVIVIEENHSYKQIVGNRTEAPYMQSLIQHGALFTNAHGVTHPSQPNYLALFSGSMQGVTNDACLKPFDAPNLASSLIKAKLTFTGYSENLPKPGFMGCSTKDYARKHNPWVQFTNVPEQLNQPFASFPDDFSQLPTVSFVVPSMEMDMHDGTILDADNWLRDHIDRYVRWAEKHNSLLILTWDEDNFAKANHIPLILVGPMVKAGTYETEVNHYNVLRTIEELYQLPYLGESKNVASMFYSLNR